MLLDQPDSHKGTILKCDLHGRSNVECVAIDQFALRIAPKPVEIAEFESDSAEGCMKFAEQSRIGTAGLKEHLDVNQTRPLQRFTATLDQKAATSPDSETVALCGDVVGLVD